MSQHSHNNPSYSELRARELEIEDKQLKMVRDQTLYQEIIRVDDPSSEIEVRLVVYPKESVHQIFSDLYGLNRREAMLLNGVIVRYGMFTKKEILEMISESSPIKVTYHGGI